jgi:hypothetical protein
MIESPIVTIIIFSTVGILSLLTKIMSIRAPTMEVIRIARKIEMVRGKKFVSETAVIPPSMTNSPCAKLIIPVVL